MIKKRLINLFSIILLLTGCVTLLASCDDSIRVLNNKEKYVLEINKVIKNIVSSEDYLVREIVENETDTTMSELIVNGKEEKFRIVNGESIATYYKILSDGVLQTYIEEVVSDVVKLMPIDALDYRILTAQIRVQYANVVGVKLSDTQWVRDEAGLKNDQNERISHSNGEVTLISGGKNITIAKASEFILPDATPLVTYSELWDKMINSNSLSVTFKSNDASYQTAAFNDGYSYSKEYNDKSIYYEQALLVEENYYAIMNSSLNDQLNSGGKYYNKLSIYPHNEHMKISGLKEQVIEVLQSIEDEYKLLEKEFVGNKYQAMTGVSIFNRIVAVYYNDRIVIESFALESGYCQIIITTDTSSIEYLSELEDKLSSPYSQTMINIVTSGEFIMQSKSQGLTDIYALSYDYVRLAMDSSVNVNDSDTFADLIYLASSKGDVEQYISRNVLGGYQYEYNEVAGKTFSEYYNNTVRALYDSYDIGYQLESLSYISATDEQGNYQYARGIFDSTPVMVEVRDKSIKIYSIWSDTISGADINAVEANDWAIDSKYNGEVIDITISAITESDIYVPSESKTNIVRNYFNSIVLSDELSLEIDGDKYYFNINKYAVVEAKNDYDYAYIKVDELYKYYYQDTVNGKVVWVDSGKNMTLEEFNTAIYSVQNKIVTLLSPYYNHCLGLDFDGNNVIKFNYDDGSGGGRSAYTLTLRNNYYHGIDNSWQHARDSYIITIKSDNHNIILKSYSDVNITFDSEVSISSAADYANGGVNSMVISDMRESDITVSIKGNDNVVTDYTFADNYYAEKVGNTGNIYIYDNGVLKHYTDDNGKTTLTRTISDRQEMLDIVLKYNKIKHGAITFLAGGSYKVDIVNATIDNNTASTIFDNTSFGKISIKYAIQRNASNGVTALSNEVVEGTGTMAYKSVRVEFGARKVVLN